MRTFTLAPQTASLLASIETFIRTHNPAIPFVSGPLPLDPEQRAFHQTVLALLPQVERTRAAILDYQRLIAPPALPEVAPGPEAGWGVG